MKTIYAGELTFILYKYHCRVFYNDIEVCSVIYTTLTIQNYKGAFSQKFLNHILSYVKNRPYEFQQFT